MNFVVCEVTTEFLTC